MEINSASFGGHVVADLTVKAEIDGNWDPPGTYKTDRGPADEFFVLLIWNSDVMMMNLERSNSCNENGKFCFIVYLAGFSFRCWILYPGYVFHSRSDRNNHFAFS